MKKFLIFIFVLIISFNLKAQLKFNDSLALSRNKITKNAMIVLGSWAAANIASGFIVASQTSGETKYAWQMNAIWNLINGGLAVMGYLNARRSITKKYDYSDNVAAQIGMEKLYALNLGLDFAYITGGFFLREKGTNETNLKSKDQLNGYGSSIIIQGAFLLLYDATILSLHHKNSVKLSKKIKSIELNAGPNGLGMVYHF
jgi:hypothetical protein